MTDRRPLLAAGACAVMLVALVAAADCEIEITGIGTLRNPVVAQGMTRLAE